MKYQFFKIFPEKFLKACNILISTQKLKIQNLLVQYFQFYSIIKSNLLLYTKCLFIFTQHSIIILFLKSSNAIYCK